MPGLVWEVVVMQAKFLLVISPVSLWVAVLRVNRPRDRLTTVDKLTETHDRMSNIVLLKQCNLFIGQLHIERRNGIINLFSF